MFRGVKVDKPKKKSKSVHDVPTVDREAGFAFKLAGDHIKCLHIAYVWMRHLGVNTPEVDALMSIFPPIEKAHGGWKSIRARANQLGTLIEFMLFASTLPFGGVGSTLARRAHVLQKIDVHDLLADAAR